MKTCCARSSPRLRSRQRRYMKWRTPLCLRRTISEKACESAAQARAIRMVSAAAASSAADRRLRIGSAAQGVGAVGRGGRVPPQHARTEEETDAEDHDAEPDGRRGEHIVIRTQV